MRKLLLSFMALVAIAIAAKAQDMNATPLTLEAVEAGSVTIQNREGLMLKYGIRNPSDDVTNVQYSTEKTLTVSLTAGQALSLECSNTDKGMNFNITTSNDVYVYGNVLSMAYGVGGGYAEKTDLTGCGYGILGFLFCLGPEGSELNPTIKNHPTKDIVLPATTLSDGCYCWMFSGCSNLTRGPQLPATTLAEDCYHRMFEYTGLVMAPELPATTLVGQCYGGMFDHCANLRYVKCLATTISDTSHGDDATTDCWMASVAPTGTFIKDDAADWSVKTRTDEALNGIPEGWTVKNSSDFDPYATPLTLEAVEAGTINIVNPNTLTIEYSKDGMTWTADNSNPISIAVAAGDVVQFRGNNPAYGMFKQVGPDAWDTKEQYTRFTATNDVYIYGNVMSLLSSTGYQSLATLPVVGGENEFDMDINLAFLFTTPVDESDWAPKINTTIKNHPTRDIVLPSVNVTRSGYMYMFSGCQGLTRAPELPATDLGWGCYHQMFSNCINLEKAPDLPAKTLPLEAYSWMFNGCTKLNYVKCLATDISVDGCTGGWLTGVAATGTFVKAAGMNDWTVGPQGEWNEVDGIPEGWTVQEEGGTGTEPGSFVAAETPLTLEAIEDGTTVTITNPLALTIEYSTDGGASWTSSKAAPITISDIAAGGTVQLRGDNEAYSNGIIATSTIIGCDKDCYLYGNIMSLVNKTGFATATELTANNTFFDLFDSNNHLKNHATKDFVLPATTLTEGCYSNLFYKCTALTKSPVLPATTLAKKCYERMLQGCKAMTTAPVLPATTLADYCYSFMFYGCNTMESAPVLPATVMADHCYSNMFGFCHAFTSTPELPATTLAENCYYRMFVGCNGLTTITSLPATTMAAYCYNEMFRQCQALKNGPVLPATTLADYCYRCMFQACTALENPSELPVTELAPGCYLGMFVNTGLTTAPALPATTLAKSCYYQMFQNCQKLVSSPILPATEMAEMSYYKMFADCPLLENVGDLSATTAAESSCEYMFQNCTSLVTAPVLAATTLAPACYNFMFSGCTKLTKAPALPATKLATQCYQRMFEFCSGLVDAPKLPATELAELCYNDMFWECTSLKNAPELPATTLADYCYTMMFLGCSSLETAPVLPAATLTPGCYEHMFMNCNSLHYVTCLATDLGDDSSTDGWLTNVAATGTFVQATGADWTVKGTTDGDWDGVPTTYVHGIPEGWTVLSETSTVGDINGDGVVDVSDYIGIANHILGLTPEGFNEQAADVNGDGVIDVSDYIGVANIILTGSIYGSQQQSRISRHGDIE